MTKLKIFTFLLISHFSYCKKNDLVSISIFKNTHINCLQKHKDGFVDTLIAPLENVNYSIEVNSDIIDTPLTIINIASLPDSIKQKWPKNIVFLNMPDSLKNILVTYQIEGIEEYEYNLKIVADVLGETNPFFAKTFDSLDDVIAVFSKDIQSYNGGISDAQNMSFNFIVMELYYKSLINNNDISENTKMELKLAFEEAFKTKEYFTSGEYCKD